MRDEKQSSPNEISIKVQIIHQHWDLLTMRKLGLYGDFVFNSNLSPQDLNFELSLIPVEKTQLLGWVNG